VVGPFTCLWVRLRDHPFASPPLETLACTESDASSLRDAPNTFIFTSHPCLSLRLFDLDEPPFLRFELVHMNKLFILFVSIAYESGARELLHTGLLFIFFMETRKGFGAIACTTLAVH